LGSSAWIKRNYTNISTHSLALLTITFWFIDDWTANDLLTMTIYDEYGVIYQQKISNITYNETLWGPNQCGDSNILDLKPVYFQASFPHTGSTLFLEIANSNWKPIERVYYGIRDIYLTFSTNSQVAPLICGSTSPTGLFSKLNCGCAYGQYRSASGSCFDCDSSCNSCFGPSSSPSYCYSCKSNHVYDGKKCAPCDSSCATCFGTGVTECLTCPSGSYLSANGTCISHCNSPFSVTSLNGIDYCDFPCGENSYLYANNSCGTTCPFPLNALNMSSYELYCNQPCGSSLYTFENLTCSSTCNAPYLPSTSSSGILICLEPCKDPTPYYNISSDLCVGKCDGLWSVKESGGYEICFYDPPYFGPITKLSNSIVPVVNIAILISCVLFMGRSWGITVIIMARMLQYTRFVAASYSTEEISNIFYWQLDFIRLNTHIEIPDFITSKIMDWSSLDYFSYYDLHKTFLLNFWQIFIALFLGICLFIPARLLDLFLSRQYTNKNFLKILKFPRLLAQNFIIFVLFSSYGDVLFFSIIQFRSLSLSSTIQVLSFLLSLTLLLLIHIILFFLLRFLWRFFKTKSQIKTKSNKKQPDQILSQLYPDIQILFHDFKDKQFFHQAFLPILVIRDFIFMLVVGLMFRYPLFQGVIITCLVSIMAIYLFVKRPFKTLLDEIQHLFFESTALLCYMTSSAVSLLDDDSTKFVGIRVFLAKVVVVISVIFEFSVLISAALQVIKVVVDFYMTKRRSRNLRPSSLNTKLSNLSLLDFQNNDKMDEKENYNKQQEDLEDSVFVPLGRKVSFILDESPTISPNHLTRNPSLAELLSHNSSTSSLLKPQEPSKIKNKLKKDVANRNAKVKRGQRPNFVVSKLPFINLQPLQPSRSQSQNIVTNRTMTLTNNLEFEDSRGGVNLRCQERDNIVASMRKVSETDLFAYQMTKTYSATKFEQNENGDSPGLLQRSKSYQIKRYDLVKTHVRENEEKEANSPESEQMNFINKPRTRRFGKQIKKVKRDY